MPKTLYRHIPVGFALLAASTAYAQSPSFSLNGTAGLIDMPSAQLLPDGETAWTFSNSGTSYGGTLTFQMLPNLETAVHFMTLPDWTALGEPFFVQTLDLKYRILEESGNLPSLAIGSRGFLSNGPLTSEYIVASKNVGYGLTVTGGLGWGRLGSYQPVASVGTRPAVDSALGFDHLFSGDMALFGGVEWDTPVKRLSLKAEYSSDAYTGEQVFGSFEHASPLNFGIDYEPVRGISVGGYYNYGSDFGLRLTLSGNPNRPIVPADLGIGPVPVNPRLGDYDRGEGWANNPMVTEFLVGALAPVLEAEGIVIEEALITGNTIDLYISNNSMPQTTKAIGRIVRTLSVALPHSVEVFRITPIASGLATTTVEIRRSDLEAQVDRPNAGPDSWASTRFTDASNHLPEGAWSRDIYPDFSWSLNPIIPVNLASNGSAASIDILLNASARYRLSHGLSVNGSLTQKLYGNIGAGAVPSTSPTPVRSNFALYQTSGPTLDRLTADYDFKLTPNTYARVSGGYLERMFAGVSGEVLWMPTNQNWGVGAEVSAVQQRGYGDMFGFEDYHTVTGHASFYWDTGYHGIEAQVDVGRYLAGDVGSTVTLTRRFENGWEVSGFVTVTDMPFADFGEGNFAKGVSVSIPLRWTMPLETRSNTGIALGTMGGDGGARLQLGERLYTTIRDYDVVDFNETWGAYWQ
jgi:hypothetical protein